MRTEPIPTQTILNPTGGFLGGGFTHTMNLYRGCATKPEFFFMAPQASDLTIIFREIATQLTNLRLAR